jgi:N-acetylmuramoyl-L-alanine amidase
VSEERRPSARWPAPIGAPAVFAVAAWALLAPASAFGDATVTARPVATAARQVSTAVHRRKTFRLRWPATHMALHWRGARRARVRVAFSRDGRRFGRAVRVALDEVGSQRGGRETYGAVMPVRRVRGVRVWSDRPLRRLSMLALRDRGAPARLRSTGQPAVVSRAGWGADESLRFDSSGNEVWPPAFWPVQKLIVHHTATPNADSDPAATIRSIYYYHAVTQGWGDIGYNFLVDGAGRVYEGRHSRSYAPGETPTGEDVGGRGVTGAHAQGFNSGTVGVALLGTFSQTNPTAAAREAIEELLVWEASRHGLDAMASWPYTNPVSGQQATFPNIAGHREVGATECPGDTFFTSLPSVRSDVVARVNAASAYVRPKGAAPLRVPLVPAYRACETANLTHGPPLSYPACGPARSESARLTVGTPDANGQPANASGSLTLRVVGGDSGTPGDQADVAVRAITTDVREAGDLSDYGGELELRLSVRVTDRASGASGGDPATVTDTTLSIALPCAATADPGSGGDCTLDTSLEALTPGVIPEGKRSLWQLAQIDVMDGGSDGIASTAGNARFEVQGLFVP